MGIAHCFQVGGKPEDSGKTLRARPGTNNSGSRIRTSATWVESERSNHCPTPALICSPKMSYKFGFTHMYVTQLKWQLSKHLLHL